MRPLIQPHCICSRECSSVFPTFCHPEYSPTLSPTTTPYATLMSPDHHHQLFSLPLKIFFLFLIVTFIYIPYKFYTIWCRSQPQRTIPQPETTGLQQSVINDLAVVKFSKFDGVGVVEGTDCTVCLTEFEEDDTLRLLPNCNDSNKDTVDATSFEESDGGLGVVGMVVWGLWGWWCGG
ncbi:hypothetical protein Hanom_Chr05g00394301 [Helianthus anomalus]